MKGTVAPNKTAGTNIPDLRLRSMARDVWRATRPFRPILAVLVILLLVFGITLQGFFTSTNLQNILTSVSVIWIVAMGMTFVLISGGLDLSVGATSSIAGILLAKLLNAGVPGGLGIMAAVALGAFIGGVINGWLVGYLKLSVFVVTLASLTALTGAVDLWSKTTSFYLTAPVVSKIANDSFLGLQIPVWIMLATFVVTLYVQSQTYFGRDVYAVGGSIQAARLSGVRVPRTLVVVYAIVGGCAGLAGVVAASRAGAATPIVDNTLALNAIAAVLLGGTSLTGGYGGVGGTVAGVLFLGTLQNGLSLDGVSNYWQLVVTGVVLVAAVLLDRWEGLGWVRRRWSSRRPGSTRPIGAKSDPPSPDSSEVAA